MEGIGGGELEYQELSNFARKRAEADGRVYDVADAENLDLKYVIENSCMTCNKLLYGNVIRIVPSRYLQEHDKYVRGGLVTKRPMCVTCYSSVKSLTRLQMKKENTVRSPFVRSMVESFLLK